MRCSSSRPRTRPQGNVSEADLLRSYLHALERADRGNLSQFVDFLCHLTRGMVRVVVGNGEESKAILGSPFPPEEMTMGDYPGLRK